MPVGFYAPALGLLWRVLDRYGVDAPRLFGELDVPENALADPDLRIPSEVVEELWHRADEEIGDIYLGLASAGLLHPSHLGPLGYAWLASPNLRAALDRLSRYVRLLSESRRVHVREEGDRVIVTTVLEPTARGSALRADVAVACLMELCRWNAGAELRAVEVDLRHPPPADPKPFEDYFGGPVRFTQSHNRLALRREDVARPLPTANPHLERLNDDYLVRYLARLDEDQFVARTQQAIGHQLAFGAPRVDAVARRMGTSARTLQRRLDEHGTTFRELLDATRRELVEQLLLDERLNLTEIAFSAGFATLSSLSSAVREWTGMPPTSYRRELLKGL